LYEFNELSEDIQEKIIRDELESLDYDIEWDFIVDDLKQQLKDLGLPDEKIDYRLGYRDGTDYFVFEGTLNSETVLNILMENYYTIPVNRMEFMLEYRVLPEDFIYDELYVTAQQKSGDKIQVYIEEPEIDAIENWPIASTIGEDGCAELFDLYEEIIEGYLDSVSAKLVESANRQIEWFKSEERIRNELGNGCEGTRLYDEEGNFVGWKDDIEAPFDPAQATLEIFGAV